MLNGDGPSLKARVQGRAPAMAVAPENQTRSRSVRSSRWSHDPLTECRKAACRAKGRRVSHCKKEGAHSATTNNPACNTEQDGPETRSAVRQAVSKALQCRLVASGLPTDRPHPRKYDGRSGWKDHRQSGT